MAPRLVNGFTRIKFAVIAAVDFFNSVIIGIAHKNRSESLCCRALSIVFVDLSRKHLKICIRFLLAIIVKPRT